jgi:hypothetical protein
MRLKSVRAPCAGVLLLAGLTPGFRVAARVAASNTRYTMLLVE